MSLAATSPSAATLHLAGIAFTEVDDDGFPDVVCVLGAEPVEAFDGNVELGRGVLDCGCVGFGWAEVDLVDPAAEGVLSFVVSTRAVIAISVSRARIEASSVSRRRQYTDGGWDPTG